MTFNGVSSQARAKPNGEPVRPLDWAAGENAFLGCKALAEQAKRSIDVPNKTKPSNWTKYLDYIEGKPYGESAAFMSGATSINRNDIFSLARSVRAEDNPFGWHALFWNVMAWGTMGDMRNVGGIAKFAAGSAARFTATLRRAAEASYSGQPQLGYNSFLKDGKVPRLGEAFFTKFLYFTGDRTADSGRCFIYDNRVRVALNIIKGEEPKLSSKTYSEYCDTVHRWSKDATSLAGRLVAPDEIEFRLYLLGQDASTHRNWLRVELAMHRRGDRSINFDSVFSQISKRDAPTDIAVSDGDLIA